MLRFIILGVVICIAMSFKTFSMPNFIKKGITSSLIAAPLLILPAISNAEFRLPPIDQRIPKEIEGFLGFRRNWKQIQKKIMGIHLKF